MDRTALQNTDNVFEKDYEITESMADKAGNATCGTLARLMQDITTMHMDEAGVSIQAMNDMDLIWVIVCTQVNIKRMPKAGEAVEQYSWAGAEKFGMYSRRYAFFTKDGEELLNAASLFLPVNKETRVLSETAKEAIKLPIAEIEGEPRLPQMAQKYPLLLFGTSHSVRESEIDYNDHVNNAVYLDWADSVFAPDFVENRKLKGFWVQYDKEVVYGQSVELKYVASESCIYLKGLVEGKDCFKVKFDY